MTGQEKVHFVNQLKYSKSCVARFHRRHDADGYIQILRQLLPTTKHLIVFDLVQQESKF